MPYVVEITGYDPVAATDKTFAFALGPGLSPSDRAYIHAGLKRWSAPSQSINIGVEGMVSSSGDTGELAIVNAPDSVFQSGPFDALADYVWQDRTATLYWLPPTTGTPTWASRVLMDTATLEQPISVFGARGSSLLKFTLRDVRATLDTPFQPTKFAGTNVGPAGVEGGPDLKGRPKPILYGLVSNFSPPLVNTSLLIYQLADKPISAICVRDGAVPLPGSVGRASLASLQSNIPAPGRFDSYTGPEGTFIRLGSSPIYGIAVDADESAGVAQQSHAQIWSRIRTERVAGSTVDAASVTAADAIDAAGAGFYWDQDTTDKAVLDEVLGSFSGYEVQNLNGTWSVAKLVLPSGTPVIDLVMMTPTVKMTATSRKLRDLSRIQPAYAKDGAPPFRVNVQWGRNYTVMKEGDIAGVVSQRLRDKFGTEYRTVSATNLSIWNPDTSVGLWRNAREMTVKTAYQPGADGISDAAAASEAGRILAMLGPLRAHYQAGFIPKPGDLILPGQVARVTYPRMGMEAGSLFRVMQFGFSVEDKNGVAVETADVVLGLKV